MVRVGGVLLAALACIALILNGMAPVSAALLAPAGYDLQINKIGPSSIPVDQRFTYTLNITNNSAITLSGVMITDTWTAQDYDGSYTATGAVNVLSAQLVTQPIRYMQFNLAPLAAGVTGSIMMGMIISDTYEPKVATIPLVVGNNALITTTTAGKTSNNDSVNTIVAGPVLSFAPSITPTDVRPGRLLTIAFAIENHNRSDSVAASNVVFTTTLPDWATLYSASPPELATAAPDGSKVVWRIPSVPVSTTTFLTLTARVYPTMTFSSRIYYTDWCLGSADNLVHPLLCANLAGVKVDHMFEKPATTYSPPLPTVPISETFPNRIMTYTVYVYNPFTQTATLRITDTLPRYPNTNEPTFVYAGLSSGNTNPPTATAVLTHGIVGWTTPPIAGWGVYSFTFNAFVPPSMTIEPNHKFYDYSNVLDGSYGDISLPRYVAGDTFDSEVRVAQQILVSKLVTPTTQIVGLPVTYTLVLSNSGPSVVGNIVITDLLPALNSCAFTYNGSIAGPAPASTGTTFAAWTQVTLTAFSQWSATFSAIASGNPYATCSNRTIGYSPDSYIVEEDNLAPVSLGQPFGYTKVAGPPVVALGGQLRYTITEQNSGGEDAVMNGFTDTLPSGFLVGTSPVYSDSVGSPFTLKANSASTYATSFAVNVAGAPYACKDLPRYIFQDAGSFGMRVTSPSRLAGFWVNGSPAAPILVVPQLVLINSVQPGVAVKGDVVTYTLVVSNNTGVVYNQIRVTDTLPANFAYGGVVSGTTPPSVNGQDLVWTNLSVPANGMRPLYFTATVSATQPGNYNDVATAASDADAFVCAPMAVSRVQVGEAAVEIVKSASQSTAGPLSKFTYSIKFYNQAAVPVTIQRFTDTLPGLVTGWRFDSMLNPGDPQPTGTTRLIWQNLVVPGGGMLNLQFNVRTGTEFGTFYNLPISGPPPAGAGQFTGTIKPGWVLRPANQFTGAPVTLVPGVGLDKVVSPGPVANGDSVVYTVTVVNLSGATIDNVVVTDTLPAGFSYEATMSGLPPTSTHPLVWTPGTMQNGDSNKVVLSFRARVSISEPGGIYYNRVNASSPSINIPDTGDIAPVQVNSTIGPHPDMVVSKSDGRMAIVVGDYLTYTIFYTNAGDAPAGGVVLTESPPANSAVSAADAWTAGGGGQYTATVPDLAIGQGGTLTFSVQITGAAPGGRYTNTVQAGASGEVNVANDSATDVDLLQRLDVRIGVDDHASAVRAGQLLTYVVTYTNTGNDAVNGLVLTETLSSGLIYTGSGWLAAGGGVYTADVGSLASGASGSMLLLAQVDPAIAGGSSVMNTAAASFNGVDANPADNTASDVDTIAPPDLSLFQDDGVAIVGPNQLLTYTFAYRNVGGTSAAGVVITESLPGAATIQDATGWTLNGGIYSYAIGALAPGAAGTVSIAARVNGAAAGTLLTSTARIGGGGDSDPSNNESTDTDIVQAAGADLQITGVQIGLVPEGYPATIMVTVTNIGTAAATTWFYTDLYVDRIPANRTDLGDYSDSQSISMLSRHKRSLAPLGAGQSVRFNYYVMFNDLATHQLYFQADTCDTTGGVPNGNCTDASYGRIPETNEANNVSGPVAVTAVVPRNLFLPNVQR